MTKYIHSIDFDGCLSNTAFLAIAVTWDKHKLKRIDKNTMLNELRTRYSQMSRGQEIPENLTNLFTQYYNEQDHSLDLNQILLQTNQQLFESLSGNQWNSTLLVGSNRQCLSTDSSNACNLLSSRFGNLKSGSCYPFFEALARNLGIKFDKLLLADLYHGKPEGTTMTEAMACDYDWNKPDTKALDKRSWLMDETKLSILYVQMHKSAAHRPNERVVFNYVDDRKDILDALYGFFEKHPEMIPKNLELNLIQYDGTKPVPVGKINGKGEVDNHYSTTLVNMAKSVVKAKPEEFERYTFQQMKEEGLSKFKTSFHTHYESHPIPRAPQRQDRHSAETQMGASTKKFKMELGEHRKATNESGHSKSPGSSSSN